MTRKAEEMFWQQMIAEVRECQAILPEDSRLLVHGPEDPRNFFHINPKALVVETYDTSPKNERRRSLTPPIRLQRRETTLKKF